MHRFGHFGGASFFLTSLFDGFTLVTYGWSASLTKHTGKSRSGAGRRRGPSPEAGEGFDGFLLAPATQSDVSGLGQNSPVALFLLLSTELEWQSS